MTADQLRRRAMLVRVRDFGHAHRDRFAHASVTVQPFAQVDAAVRLLDDAAVARVTSGRSTAERAAARAALLEALMRISRTSRVIDPATPGAQLFRVPRFRTDHVLIALGRLFVREARPRSEYFTALGMVPTFIAALETVVERFAGTVRASETGKGARIAARVGVDVTLRQATAALRCLDVVVFNLLGSDPLLMAQWRRTRRVGSRRRRAVGGRGGLRHVNPPVHRVPPNAAPLRADRRARTGASLVAGDRAPDQRLDTEPGAQRPGASVSRGARPGPWHH